MSNKRLWITWETQQRNTSLSKVFNCEFKKIDLDDSKPFSRYFYSILETYRTVSDNNYKIIISQCPSLVLVLTLYLLRFYYKYNLILDVHNSAIDQTYSKSIILRNLSRFLFKRVDAIIVSNESLKKELEFTKTKILVLPDSLPELKPAEKDIFEDYDRPRMVLIASYHEDEPISEFLNAVKEEIKKGTLFITGKRTSAGSLTSLESDRIKFTDFLSKPDYHRLLLEADYVIDLTTRESCLVCGAYEALSAEVPAILSKDPEMISLFGDGFCYTENTPEDFKFWMNEIQNNRLKPSADKIKQSKADFKEKWDTFYNIVSQYLNDLEKATEVNN